jgi:RHS repeat-associated protein
LKYSYDNNFRVTDQELWVTNPNSEDFDALNFYDYDQDGLLTALTLFQYTVNGGWWCWGGMGIEYDPATGRITGTNSGNVNTSQDYDSSGALSYFETDFVGLHPFGRGSSIFQTSYQRDSLNRIRILTEVNQGLMTVKKYAYDIVGRLSQVWRNDTLVSSYSYDANGNRIARWTPSKTDSGSYDVQDRMLSYGSAQYIYSKNGELQKKIVGADTTSYMYDYFGNLMSVRLPNGNLVEYIIDGQNRRIGKKLNGAIVKKWIYAGRLSPVAELDSAGNVTAEFVGSLMMKNGNTYQLVTDHLGSVRLVVDINSGAIVQQLDYDEYGNVLSNSNPDFQPFAYAGGLYDTQTKLVRFGARDYDASVGRWTCKDPIGFKGRQSNIYIYAKNNPVNYIDRTGLGPNWLLVAKGTGLIIGGIALDAAGIGLTAGSGGIAGAIGATLVVAGSASIGGGSALFVQGWKGDKHSVFENGLVASILRGSRVSEQTINNVNLMLSGSAVISDILTAGGGPELIEALGLLIDSEELTEDSIKKIKDTMNEINQQMACPNK